MRRSLVETGSTIVELALTMPLLLLLLCGAFDLGSGISAAFSVAHAAREGARFASSAEYIDQAAVTAQIRSVVENRLQPEKRITNLTVSNTTPASATGMMNALGQFCDQQVTVSVDARYQALLPGVFGLASFFDLSRRVTMRYNRGVLCG